MFHCTYFVKIN